MVDYEDYPFDEDLQRIKDWPFNDIDSVFAFVKSLWHWGVGPEWEMNGVLYLATGGWSGNESIISAMMENIGIAARWICSARGGAHEFELHAQTTNSPNRETRFTLEARLAQAERVAGLLKEALIQRIYATSPYIEHKTGDPIKDGLREYMTQMEMDALYGGKQERP